MVGGGRGPAPSLAFAALGPTQISFSRTLFSTVDGTGSLKGQDTLAVTFARLSPAPGYHFESRDSLPANSPKR